MKSYNVTGVLGVVAGVRWLLVWFRVYSEDPIRYLGEEKEDKRRKVLMVIHRVSQTNPIIALRKHVP